MRPSDEVLAWVSEVAGAVVTGVTGLRAGGTPWIVRFADAPAVVLRTADGDHDRFGVEVAALAAAEEHGLPAPRLIAFNPLLPAMAMTALAGTSKLTGPPSTSRLRALGAVTARLTAPMTPTDALPLRAKPLDSEEFTARSPAQVEALAAVADYEPAPARPVLVHGDLWQGNTVWDGDTCLGIVDWEYAGVGPHGVDLGSLRCDVATSVGVEAVDEVLAGWEAEAGGPAAEVAYWDVMAGLSTPADMADWLPVLHDQGRTDLDGPTATARRDAFLRTAIVALGR
ncbi:phosphotransferase [Actinokineospora sp. NBRC 105648]|uniref:phosphotransferase n=1 Tax=Actinokineospora sp. NBRC 105648 TaxID=3032206 RepID=UPI0024A300BF|nr:phosphotransferase [Actinokineospora sp. NBRC 105648]GLZ43138.1 hypothetical protein Acsp05_67620 [Actinokineospora sp. NBRC 105648]